MCDQQTIRDIDSGKKRVIGRWEYLMNYWTPLFALIVLLIGGVLWYSNAEGRMFSDQKTKVKTEEHVNQSIHDEEEFITRKEFDTRLREYLEIAKENQKDIKEILIYLRK